MIKLIIAALVLIACVGYLLHLTLKGIREAGEAYFPDDEKEERNEN